MDSTNSDMEITNETYLMQVNSHGFDNSDMYVAVVPEHVQLYSQDFKNSDMYVMDECD